MPDHPLILIVDDNRDLRELLGRYLKQQGFGIELAASGADLRARLQHCTPDLLLLDIMMPGEDGLSLCRYLHEHRPELPIIFLTARAEGHEKIEGLNIGADDYITKPYDPAELLARIRAVLRRSGDPVRAVGHEQKRCYAFGDWTLNTADRTLTGSNQVEVSLSAAEYRLLLVFLRHPGQVLSREQLLQLTAGRDSQTFDRAIDNQISRLRRKLEPDSDLITTLRGDGYQLRCQVSTFFQGAR